MGYDSKNTYRLRADYTGLLIIIKKNKHFSIIIDTFSNRGYSFITKYRQVTTHQ